MEGNICGVDNTMKNDSLRDMSEKPYLYYPTLRDLSVQICVTNCPSESHAFPVTNDEVVCLYTVDQENLTPAGVVAAVASGDCWGTYRSTDSTLLYILYHIQCSIDVYRR